MARRSFLQKVAQNFTYLTLKTPLKAFSFSQQISRFSQPVVDDSREAFICKLLLEKIKCFDNDSIVFRVVLMVTCVFTWTCENKQRRSIQLVDINRVFTIVAIVSIPFIIILFAFEEDDDDWESCRFFLSEKMFDFESSESKSSNRSFNGNH